MNRDSQIIRSQELFEICTPCTSTEKQSSVVNNTDDSTSKPEPKKSNTTTQSSLKTLKSFQSTNDIIMSKFYCLNQNPNEELDNKINEDNSEEAVKSIKNQDFAETFNDQDENNLTMRQNQRNHSAKYFTMSSTAGQKFKQILKKYV